MMSTNSLNEIKQIKNSKYSSSDIDPTPSYYLFVINFDSKKKSKKIQKITTDNSKFLITNKEKINFKKYNKIKLELLNIKKPTEDHVVDLEIQNEVKIYKDSKIYLEVSNNSGYINLFYNINLNQLE